MAIYIKGVGMPKTAFECSTKINPDERRCNYTGKVFEETYGLLVEHTCPDCPLVYIPEPHGRLIDADKLADDLEIDGRMFNQVYKLNCASWLRSKSTPTVIEGSE